MNLNPKCEEVVLLLKEHFPDSGYYLVMDDIVFYFDMGNGSSLTVSMEPNDVAYRNKHEIVNRILAHWL
jgi:hypothetical protein